MTTLLIGLDDTDNPTSKGTGHLARQLMAECLQRGLASAGVTRHQFLVHPDIPYTSHNSGACLALACEGPVERAFFAFDFVASRSAEGSDPGVCIALDHQASPALLAFGTDAAARVLQIPHAVELARSLDIPLRPLGGTGQGVIGALASVAQRAGGNDGRFIDLPGLRDLPARVPLEAFARLGIRLQFSCDGRQPGPGDACETLDWVRPRLLDHLPVLPLTWSQPHDAWIPADRKRSRPLE